MEKPLPPPPLITTTPAVQVERPVIKQRVTSLPSSGLVAISQPENDDPLPPPSPGLSHCSLRSLSDDDAASSDEDDIAHIPIASQEEVQDGSSQEDLNGVEDKQIFNEEPTSDAHDSEFAGEVIEDPRSDTGDSETARDVVPGAPPPYHVPSHPADPTAPRPPVRMYRPLPMPLDARPMNPHMHAPGAHPMTSFPPHQQAMNAPSPGTHPFPPGQHPGFYAPGWHGSHPHAYAPGPYAHQPHFGRPTGFPAPPGALMHFYRPHDSARPIHDGQHTGPSFHHPHETTRPLQHPQSAALHHPQVRPQATSMRAPSPPSDSPLPRSSFEDSADTSTLSSSLSALDVSSNVSGTDSENAPRPTFRKLTLKRQKEANRASVMKVSFDQTIAMYRENALKSGDSRLKYEFAKFCIEESAKLTDSKSKEMIMDEGFAILKELAKSGNPDAMYTLGQAYLDDQKYGLAHAQLVQAAKRSHAGACYLVAKCSEKGLGTKKSNRVSLDFYNKAAQAGFKPALYRLGMIELRGELGTRRDVRKAVMWLKRGAAVADKEHPQPLFQLALIFEAGVPPHIQQDEGYARGLLIEAAGLDYAPAQYKLGCCYEFARVGCPRDLREAIYWYRKAAENGDTDAAFALAGWYLQGCEGALEQNDHEAYSWTYKAALKDHAKAQYAIGYFCETGIGCTQNMEKAVRWYRLSARLGDERALAKVGHEAPSATSSTSSATKEGKGLFGFLGKK
ncbi:hypothetical protein SpCBS45565_g04941 [Spizellomyces sp. 'palustris']|nr:hypothetical protein SpCBS45565_g04941 [Spizellomyces sp. 'palustris']